MAETYYDTLDVAPDADNEELRRAFRRAARRWSPDHNPAPDAHERMVQVNLAREHLLDPTKRRAYDEGLRGHGGAHVESNGSAGERIIRVVPLVTDLGELVAGDSRLVEIDVFVTGPEPGQVDIDPESGEGWHIDEVLRPDDTSGRYLSVRLLVQPTDATPNGSFQGDVDLVFDGDTVRASFSWTVASPLPVPSPVPPWAAAPTPPVTPSSVAAPPSYLSTPTPTAPAASPATSHGSSLPSVTSAGRGPSDDERLVRFSLKVIGGSIAAWLLTPLIASFGTGLIPGLATAVFTPGENNGRSAGNAPVLLYQHLGVTLLLFDVVLVVLCLTLGREIRYRWPVVVGVLLGLTLFFWFVGAQGGALWQWDILPIATLIGVVGAQLLSRHADARHLSSK